MLHNNNNIFFNTSLSSVKVVAHPHTVVGGIVHCPLQTPLAQLFNLNLTREQVSPREAWVELSWTRVEHELNPSCFLSSFVLADKF